MLTHRLTRLARAAVAAITLLAVVSAPAEAQRHGASSVTARVPNPTPAVGEEFIVRGRYLLDGAPAAGHDVKVQTYRNRHWLDLDGARVAVRSDGRYRVRVILFVRGVRDLRVVGLAGPGYPNSFDRIVVEVVRH